MRLSARMEMELWSIFFQDFFRVEGQVNGERLDRGEREREIFARKRKKREREKERTSNALGKKRSLPRNLVDYAKTDQPLSEILKGNERTRRSFPKRPSNLL